jgi:hypothetical protein
MIYSVYCSGSILKGPSDNKRLCWTDSERAEVSKGAAPNEVVFLNPDDPIPDPRNTLGQFGRDMYQVMVASAIIVDARERRGIGIGVEIAAAAAMGTPVIAVVPPDTNYRQRTLEYRGVVIEDYVHPHLFALATALVDDFEAAGRRLSDMPTMVDRRAAVPAWLVPAVDEYEKKVLALDSPMTASLAKLRKSSTTASW